MSRPIRFTTLSRLDIQALRAAVRGQLWALEHVAAMPGPTAVLADAWLRRHTCLTLSALLRKHDEVAPYATAHHAHR